MKFILITGHAQEGKTTLTNKIKDKFKINDYALADALKNITHDMFKLFKIPFPELKEEIRPYYQQIGTEICRKYLGNDIWCEAVEKETNKNNEKIAIVSDVRFINEAEYFKNRYDSILIRILNPELKTILNHQSETEINQLNPDYIQIRTESHDDLFKFIEEFIEK